MEETQFVLRNDEENKTIVLVPVEYLSDENSKWYEGPTEEEFTRNDVWSADKIDMLLSRLAARAHEIVEKASLNQIDEEMILMNLEAISILLEVYKPEITKAINQ